MPSRTLTPSPKIDDGRILLLGGTQRLCDLLAVGLGKAALQDVEILRDNIKRIPADGRKPRHDPFAHGIPVIERILGKGKCGQLDKATLVAKFRDRGADGSPRRFERFPPLS